MNTPEPREGRCWTFFHRWSKWKPRWYIGREPSEFEIKTCLRCGRRKQRWIG